MRSLIVPSWLLMNGILAFAGMVPAQGAPAGSRPVVESMQLELARLQREFEETVIRASRLTTMQFRHALGLRIDAEKFFQLTEVERQWSVEQLNAALQTEENELSRLAAMEQQLKRQFEHKRAAALQRVSASTEDTWPSMESPTLQRPVRAPLRRDPENVEPWNRQPAADTAQARRDSPVIPAPSANTPVLVKGSMDHSAVGRALFHAGRFEDAARELALVVKDEKTAALVDVFYLARCREQLQDLGGAESLYLTIIARDERETGEGMVTGPWARSARSALKIMRWMDDKGTWRPSTSIESLRTMLPQAEQGIPDLTGAR